MDPQSGEPCTKLRLEKHSSSMRSTDIRFVSVPVIPRALLQLSGLRRSRPRSLFLDKHAFLHGGFVPSQRRKQQVELNSGNGQAC